MTNFATYIDKHAKHTDDPAGDFIEDARGDIRQPLRDRSPFPTEGGWPAIESYLINRRAHPDAVSAAREVWKRYRAWQRRQDSKP